MTDRNRAADLERTAERTTTAEDTRRQAEKARSGASAKDLKGVSAVPTEGDRHGKGGGADPKKTPGDEVDPGVG